MPSTAEQVEAALSPLVGMLLVLTHRAVDLRVFRFAQAPGAEPTYSLHVQCAWRIEGPDGIVAGRTDLWDPADPEEPFSEDWDYDTSPNLQDALVGRLMAGSPGLAVERAEGDAYGGAALHLAGGHRLRIFPAGTRGEDWRVFRSGSRRHFVVSGGRVEE